VRISTLLMSYPEEKTPPNLRYFLPLSYSTREFYLCRGCGHFFRHCNAHACGKSKFKWYCPLCNTFKSYTRRASHIRKECEKYHPDPNFGTGVDANTTKIVYPEGPQFLVYEEDRENTSTINTKDIFVGGKAPIAAEPPIAVEPPVGDAEAPVGTEVPFGGTEPPVYAEPPVGADPPVDAEALGVAEAFGVAEPPVEAFGAGEFSPFDTPPSFEDNLSPSLFGLTF